MYLGTLAEKTIAPFTFPDTSMELDVFHHQVCKFKQTVSEKPKCYTSSKTSLKNNINFASIHYNLVTMFMTWSNFPPLYLKSFKFFTCTLVVSVSSSNPILHWKSPWHLQRLGVGFVSGVTHVAWWCRPKILEFLEEARCVVAIFDRGTQRGRTVA